MHVIRKETGNKERHLELLLLADPSKRMIDRYLKRSDLFVMEEEGRTVCVAAVTKEAQQEYELKNLAVLEDMQGLGYGRKMVEYLFAYYKGKARVMWVGTGKTKCGCIGFYEKCGFAPAHIVQDFFTDHYEEPIIENGVRLRDMQYLKKTL